MYLSFILSVCSTPPLNWLGVVMIPFRPTAFCLNDSTTDSRLALWTGWTSLKTSTCILIWLCNFLSSFEINIIYHIIEGGRRESYRSVCNLPEGLLSLQCWKSWTQRWDSLVLPSMWWIFFSFLSKNVKNTNKKLTCCDYLGIEFYCLVCFSWTYEATEGPRLNFVMHEALFEIYTWILCRFIPPWETNK